MVKKVTIIKGYNARCGPRGTYGCSKIREKYIIDIANVIDLNDSYYLIEGKAKLYKGNSLVFHGEIPFKRRISKFLIPPSSLTFEDVSVSTNYILED